MWGYLREDDKKKSPIGLKVKDSFLSGRVKWLLARVTLQPGYIKAGSAAWLMAAYAG
jgi:hypothetical protein